MEELRRRLQQRHDILTCLSIPQLPTSCHLIITPAFPHCAYSARISYDVPKSQYLHNAHQLADVPPCMGEGWTQQWHCSEGYGLFTHQAVGSVVQSLSAQPRPLGKSLAQDRAPNRADKTTPGVESQESLTCFGGEGRNLVPACGLKPMRLYLHSMPSVSTSRR